MVISIVISYLRRHEKWLTELLKDGPAEPSKYISFNRQQIAVLQAERLAHLIVTMSVGISLLISFLMVMLFPSWPTIVLALVLSGLFIGYIRHYFLLENGLQRLYEKSRDLEEKTIL